MPVQRVHVRDHNRRKPYQTDRIHVDDYNRVQDINAHAPPGAAELGPTYYGEPTPMGAVAIHEFEIDLVNQIRKIEEQAGQRGEMTEDELYRHERLNDELIAMRNRRNHPDQIEVLQKVTHESTPPYDPAVFNPQDVMQTIADENDLDIKTAAEVHDWLMKTDPEQLEPLEEVDDEGATIPVPDPDAVQEALEALGYPGHHGNVDRQTEQIEAIEKELHGEEAELEETVDKVMEVADNLYGTAKQVPHESPKERLIDSMIFHPDGQVYVSYNDSDLQTDYFDSYTLRQKHAIDWIKKSGDTTISGSTTNSTYDEAVRANRFFDRVEKETGRKVRRHGIHVVLERYKNPDDAAKDWEGAREKLQKVGLKPALYHEDRWGGPGEWMIASDNIEWRGWRNCTWALGPGALPDKGEADVKDLVNKHGVSKTEAEKYLKDKALGKYN